MPSPLIDFYQGHGRDHRGRTLAEIHAFPADQLEREHDFIQWLFPLRDPSPVNPHAPVLTDADVAAFTGSVELRDRLRKSFGVMLDFYGFASHAEGGAIKIRRDRHLAARSAEWLHAGSHNFLRITRILKSLAILGEVELAKAFLDCLEGIFSENRAVIGERTWRFWQNAANEND